MANKVPIVTGISPNKGVPGTKIVIRGENLGSSALDVLHVIIGSTDVGRTVEWYSSKKLHAFTPLGEGELKIIVVTQSGGFGTSTVTYTQKVPRGVGAQEQVSFWPEDERRVPAIIERSKSTQPRMLQSESTEDTLIKETGKISVPLSDEALKKYLPDSTGSTDLSAPEFDPIMYLVKFHKNTSYADLLNASKNFERSLSCTQSEEPLVIVKANLYTVFQCLDKLEALKKQLEEERRFTGSAECVERRLENTVAVKGRPKGKPMPLPFMKKPWKATVNEPIRAALKPSFQVLLTQCRDHGHQLFREVLKNKDLADSARTTLTVMQRFKFLFNLPHAIRENIDKNEYNIVINDYLRVKGLFGNTEVAIFKAVYQDVEDVIDNFKKSLQTKLKTMPCRFEDVKENIRYLVQLKVPDDPAWKCVLFQKDWIVDQIKVIYKTYAKESSQNMRPPVVAYVEEVSQLMANNFPQFWKLGSSYVSGQLFEKEIRTLQMEDLLTERKEIWNSMNTELFQLFSTYLRGNILESGCDDLVTSGWIPHCIAEFRSCFARLPLAEFNDNIKRTICQLSRDLRKHCVRLLFRRAEHEIDHLKFKEAWNTEMTDDHGATTQLPLLYENIVMDTITSCKDYLKARLILEVDLLSHDDVQQEFPTWCSTMLCALVNCFKQLADSLDQECLQDDNSFSSGHIDSISEDPQQSQIQNVSKSRGTILLVNNCQVVLDVVLPRLIAACRSQHYPGTEKAHVQTVSALNALHAVQLTRYVELKAGPVYGPIEVHMTSAKFSWQNAPTPIACKDYIKNVIRELGRVYAEVLLVSPRYAGPVMETMTTRVVEEMSRCLQTLGAASSSDWSRAGQLQAAIDLRLLEAAVAGHINPESKSMLNLTQASLGKRWTASESHLMDQILVKEKARMRLVLEGLANAA